LGAGFAVLPTAVHHEGGEIGTLERAAHAAHEGLALGSLDVELLGDIAEEMGLLRLHEAFDFLQVLPVLFSKLFPLLVGFRIAHLLAQIHQGVGLF
jgi:hypothetical protein